MKKLVSVLLALVLVLSLGACGEKPAEGSKQPEGSKPPVSTTETKPLKVGFTLPSMTFPFYVRMYDQIMAEAETRGWEVSFADGNLDAGTQLNGAQDMLNDGIDVLIMATWWIDAMSDIFAQCEEKGISVFLMDNMQIPAGTEGGITFSTGTDNENAGVVGGTWYADYLKGIDKTEVNVVLISSQTEQQVKRCSGFVDGLKANGITVNVLNTYDGGKRETAMSAAEDALTAFSNVDVLYGGSAQDSLGAFDATQGANRTNVMVIGFDGEDEEIEKIDAKTNYIATITQDPVGQAKLVAEYVAKWQNGETFEQKEETPAGVYCEKGQLTGADILG